jgi:hypothetical protein
MFQPLMQHSTNPLSLNFGPPVEITIKCIGPMIDAGPFHFASPIHALSMLLRLQRAAQEAAWPHVCFRCVSNFRCIIRVSVNASEFVLWGSNAGRDIVWGEIR